MVLWDTLPFIIHTLAQNFGVLEGSTLWSVKRMSWEQMLVEEGVKVYGESLDMKSNYAFDGRLDESPASSFGWS